MSGPPPLLTYSRKRRVRTRHSSDDSDDSPKRSKVSSSAPVSSSSHPEHGQHKQLSEGTRPLPRSFVNEKAAQVNTCTCHNVIFTAVLKHFSSVNNVSSKDSQGVRSSRTRKRENSPSSHPRGNSTRQYYSKVYRISLGSTSLRRAL